MARQPLACRNSRGRYGRGWRAPSSSHRSRNGGGMPVDVELSRPLWLVALPLLAAVLVAVRLPWWRAAYAQRATSPRPLRSEARRLLIRLAWLALPVLALAGLAFARPMDRMAIVFV